MGKEKGILKTVQLSNSDKVAIVDDEDYEFINRYNWTLHTGGYAQTCVKQKPVYMHRLINNTPKGKQTDHANKDKLDNRKANLRTCEQYQNQANSIKPNATTGYRGVVLQKRKYTKPYQAKIRINGRHTHLGMFATAEEAAMEYNVYAYIYYGKFATLNKVLPS
jgi:hypothetical protein